MIRDVGILGTGLWDGPAIGNDAFGPESLERARAREPFRGRRREDGTVHIAGLELQPDRHRRTIAAVERSFTHPFRGTRHRRHFPADLKVSDAEAEAAGKALGDAGLAAQDIDVLLCQSFLPNELHPKNGALVAEKLGLRTGAAWETDSMCSSALAQLYTGAALVACDEARHVLCVQSVPFSWVVPESVSARVLIGDMASAFVIGRRPGATLSMSWRTDGRFHGAAQFRRDGAPFWAAAAAPLEDHFDEVLHAQVMREIAAQGPVVCHEALRRAELRLDEVELFISHQPLSWFAAFMADVLGLRDGLAYTTFEEYGSITSCSLTASIHEARRAGRIAPGRRVLLFAPGAGNTYGAAALRW